jgi:hypothetical protein
MALTIMATLALIAAVVVVRLRSGEQAYDAREPSA